MLKSISSMLYSLVLSVRSLFGIQSEESPKYDVIKRHGPIEIRNYRAYLAAQTEDVGDYESATRPSFFRLFNYISGANKSQEKIAMTAPVTREPRSEAIEMTAPVFRERGQKGWIMRFVIPSDYDIATVPMPIDPKVTIQEIPASKVAVIRFSGVLNENAAAGRQAELLTWLSSNNIAMLSAPRTAGYNPPWTLPFLRRNEIHVEIE